MLTLIRSQVTDAWATTPGVCRAAAEAREMLAAPPDWATPCRGGRERGGRGGEGDRAGAARRREMARAMRGGRPGGGLKTGAAARAPHRAGVVAAQGGSSERNL